MIPRLNIFGYAFYRAGFRLPGPNKPLTLANSATLISDVTLGHSEPGSTDNLTADKIKSSLNLGDLERGIQVARTSGPLSVRLSWLNGVNSAGKGGVSLPGNRFHDFVLQSDYKIGKEGSMIGALFYLGKTPLGAAGYTNNFQRAGLTSTWAKILKSGKAGIPAMQFELNSAVIWGEDAVSASGHHENSLVAILEADLYLHNRTALFVRYDGGRSPTTDGTPTSDAFTVGAAHRFTRNVQAELEYRNRRDSYSSTVLFGLNLSL